MVKVANCVHASVDGCARGLKGGKPAAVVCVKMCGERVARDGPDIVQVSVPRAPYNGASEWEALHRRALAYAGDETAEIVWLNRMAKRLPCGSCRAHWQALVAKHPPDLSSADAYWRWTVDRHNDVSQRLGKPSFTLDAARERWGG